MTRDDVTFLGACIIMAGGNATMTPGQALTQALAIRAAMKPVECNSGELYPTCTCPACRKRHRALEKLREALK